MSRIKASKTKPENLVAALLREMKIKYRRNVRNLPGCPDFRLIGERKVILVHGCFWHRHSCRAAAIPSSNRKFWLHKFRANMMRDKEVRVALRKSKYRSLILWECQVEKSGRALENRIIRFAASPSR